jgi:DNA-binding transcriptional ArsR family regulator
MPHLASTSDAFNAIAEPRRRQILAELAKGESSVKDLVAQLRMSQPLASKHLRVLRDVGLVHARKAGKQRLYTLNGEGLRAIHDWVSRFESHWAESFDRLDEYLSQGQPKQGQPHGRSG